MSILAKISANRNSMKYIFTSYKNRSSAGTTACYKQINILSWGALRLRSPGCPPKAPQEPVSSTLYWGLTSPVSTGFGLLHISTAGGPKLDIVN